MFDIDNGTFINSVSGWIDLAISLVVLGLALYGLHKVLRRKLVAYSVFTGSILLLVSWFFGFQLLWGVSLILLIALITVTLIINQGEVRDLMSNSLGLSSKPKNQAEKIFDRHAMLSKVAIAVENLSKNKIGAIITFEKNTKLDDFVKSGTILDAPITPELLMTIFYPGTRLHDGAVVIRRNIIMAASVYYTPTTKPLTGKFGSRHRAAIGISEVTDSVTVVVSEETGRISLAVAGELIHVTPDNFLRVLEDYVVAEANEAK